MFNGYYDNFSRPDTPTDEGIWLIMKWSDEWLSNKDFNGDGKLDRGYSCDPVNETKLKIYTNVSAKNLAGVKRISIFLNSLADNQTTMSCAYVIFSKMSYQLFFG